MIGKNIKHFRTFNNMTQEYVAKKMKISATTLSFWENDMRMPSFKNIQELAKVFRIPAIALVDGKLIPEFSPQQEKLLVLIKMLNDMQCEMTQYYLTNLLDIN